MIHGIGFKRNRGIKRIPPRLREDSWYRLQDQLRGSSQKTSASSSRALAKLKLTSASACIKIARVRLPRYSYPIPALFKSARIPPVRPNHGHQCKYNHRHHQRFKRALFQHSSIRAQQAQYKIRGQSNQFHFSAPIPVPVGGYRSGSGVGRSHSALRLCATTLSARAPVPVQTRSVSQICVLSALSRSRKLRIP